jgi:transposase
MAMTLIRTAKLNGLDLMAWLTDVLERVVSGYAKAHELDILLPWNWKPSELLMATALSAQPQNPTAATASTHIRPRRRRTA